MFHCHNNYYYGINSSDLYPGRQVATSKDPEGEVGMSGPMGVIPASTMLKIEFRVIIPDGETQGNVLVSGRVCEAVRWFVSIWGDHAVSIN